MPSRPRYRFLHAVLLSWLSVASAEEVDVGGQMIEIPTPAGFTNLVPAHSPYYETSKAFEAPGNIRYVSLLPKETAEILEKGGFATYRRYMNVETARNISARNISTVQFEELRDVLRNQLNEMMANVEEALPGIIDKANADISEEFDADLELSVGDLVPLPVHQDSANAIAYTMFMTVASSADGVAEELEVSSATMLTLLVNERVLFLYVYGTEDDVEWTRSTAASWADAILAANSGGAGARDAQAPEDTSGSAWRDMLTDPAVVTIVILVLIWLIWQVAVKPKRRE